MNLIGNYNKINQHEINPQSSFQIRFLFYKLEHFCKKIPSCQLETNNTVSSRIIIDLTSFFSNKEQHSLILTYRVFSTFKVLTITNQYKITHYQLNPRHDDHVRDLLAEMNKRAMDPEHWKLSDFFKLQNKQKRVPTFISQCSKKNREKVVSLDLSYTTLFRNEVEHLIHYLPKLRELNLKGACQIEWSQLSLPKNIYRLDVTETNLSLKKIRQFYLSMMQGELLSDNNQAQFLLLKLKYLCQKIPPSPLKSDKKTLPPIVICLQDEQSQAVTLEYHPCLKSLTMTTPLSMISYQFDSSQDQQVRHILAEMCQSLLSSTHWDLTRYFRLQTSYDRASLLVINYSKESLEKVISLDLSYTSITAKELCFLLRNLPKIQELILKGVKLEWARLALPDLIERLDVSETNITAEQIGKLYQSTKNREIVSENCERVPPIISTLTRYTYALRKNPTKPDLSFMKNPKFNRPKFLEEFFKHILIFPKEHQRTVFYLQGFNLSQDIKNRLEMAKQTRVIQGFITD